MSLSMDLISQFVKITKDRPSEKKETILYGTIVERKTDDGSTNYVRIDGSDLLTPYDNKHGAAATVKNGDRVTLTIKNHSVIITGNISDPSASSGVVNTVKNITNSTQLVLDGLKTEKATIAELNAVDAKITELAATHATFETATLNRLNAAEAEIDDLTADNATFKTATVNRLSAAEADIDDLTAKNTDITGRLTAAEAVIGNLDATYIRVDEFDAINGTITNLDSKYAKITELDAVKADVEALDAGVAEIDTLIFGSATGTTIQTSFSNAVIAQLGDAQIKSAMIDSISASKITAGDISTNNVRILSDDGRMLLSDETIQISDANRVRVQIGKDASNDYSINIWDQNGNLMFSKGGITDAAIKQAIIRNDMVSDTANIAAHKLDIDSLFDEINGSTNTIKSTKVYLDEEGQTLDVAFKSLSNTVTSHGETITSQGTAISTIQGQITSKIWQQDVDTAKSEMSTQYSTLEQSLGTFKTTVGETYATITDVEGIEIGGRNLLLDSAKTVENAEYILAQISFADPNAIEAGETYTVSFDGMLSDSVQKGFYINVFPAPNKGCCSINAISKDGVYHRYKATFVMPDNGSFTRIGIYSAEVGNFKLSGVKNVKLERGNKATDWTPAPEDLDSRVSAAETMISQNKEAINLRALSTDVTTAKQEAIDSANQNTANLLKNYSTTAQMQSAIEVRAGSILSSVQSTYATQETVSTLEQTAEGLTLRLDNQKIGGFNLLNDSEKVISTKRFMPVNTRAALMDHVGKEITVSFDMKLDEGGISRQIQVYPYQNNGISISGTFYLTPTFEWQRFYITTYVKDWGINNTTWTDGSIGFYDYAGENAYSIRKVKIELGNVPTEWCRSDYDISNSIANAGKTASNYLGFSSAGLVVGDFTSSTLGKNVLIDSEAIKMRTGSAVNAVFGADIIELAKNNASATISMLNGAFKIYYDADNSDGGFGVYGVTSTGEERLAFQPVNENDNLTLGWGGYNAKKNCTNIYGHNMNLVAGNDLAIECDDWKINIDGNLFAKASDSSFVELIGLSSDDNVTIGHGGYTAKLGKTHIYGNSIRHIVNTTSGSVTYKPYYEAGDSFETEWYGAGFISSSSKVVYFSIPLAKPIVGATTPTVTVTNGTTSGGLQIRQDTNYVFGSTSGSKVAPSSYSAKVVGDGNFVQIEATMANSTNAVNNAPCGINASIKITFS